MRKGLGKGKGKGYKNMLRGDSKVHSQSAKGIKQTQRVTMDTIRFNKWTAEPNNEPNLRVWTKGSKYVSFFKSGFEDSDKYVVESGVIGENRYIAKNREFFNDRNMALQKAKSLRK